MIYGFIFEEVKISRLILSIQKPTGLNPYSVSSGQAAVCAGNIYLVLFLSEVSIFLIFPSLAYRSEKSFGGDTDLHQCRKQSANLETLWLQTREASCKADCKPDVATTAHRLGTDRFLQLPSELILLFFFFQKFLQNCQWNF